MKLFVEKEPQQYAVTIEDAYGNVVSQSKTSSLTTLQGKIRQATTCICLNQDEAKEVRKHAMPDIRVGELNTCLPWYNTKGTYHTNFSLEQLKLILGVPSNVNTLRELYYAIEYNHINIDKELDDTLLSMLQALYEGKPEATLKSEVLAISGITFDHVADSLVCQSFAYQAKHNYDELAEKFKKYLPNKDIEPCIEQALEDGAAKDCIKQISNLYATGGTRYFELPEIPYFDINEQLNILLFSSGLTYRALHYGSKHPFLSDTVQMTYDDITKILQAIFQSPKRDLLLKYLSPNTITMDNGIVQSLPNYTRSRNFGSMRLYRVQRKIISVILTVLSGLDISPDSIVKQY